MDKLADSVDVVVVGSCMIDMICYTPRIPTPGETLRGTSFELGHGGKGANQCVAAAKLGAHCALVAVLGNDEFGVKYHQQLKRIGVNIDHVKLSEERHSGIAQITVTESGENCIVIVPGSNSLLSMEDVIRADEILLKAKVVVFQLETPVKTTFEALRYLKNKAECTTILNAAPASSELPSGVYELCDIFCVNEVEAGQLSGHDVSDLASATDAAQFFKSAGCKIVIITLGEKGIVYLDSTGESVHLPVKEITPVDSTGAGDAFVGALAYYIAREPYLPLSVQIQRSAHIATESVLKCGTQASYPTKDELPKDLFGGSNLK